MSRSRIALALILGFGLTGTLLEAQSAGSPAAVTVQQVRAALDKYKDPVVAVHDGYFSTLGCIEYPAGGDGTSTMKYAPGGMGVHFLNPAAIGPTLDPMKPQVLIYVPVGNRLELAAAEWFVPVAVSKTAPRIFDKSLEGPMEGHHPLLPAELTHWDLHVWLWKDNPAGMFSSTNPAVKCPPGPYSFQEKAPRIVTP